MPDNDLLIGFVLADLETGVLAQPVHQTREKAQAELAWRNRTSRHRFDIYELRRLA